MTRAISHDRVKFVIPNRMLDSKMETLLRDVFDTGACGIGPRDLTIICRPSQFARFVILRNIRGISNEFKALEPRLFTPVTDVLDTIDVSKRPNTLHAPFSAPDTA